MRKTRFTEEQMVAIVREADRERVAEVANERTLPRFAPRSFQRQQSRRATREAVLGVLRDDRDILGGVVPQQPGGVEAAEQRQPA